MKITAVTGYKSSYNLNQNPNHNRSNNHTNVTFGFSEDYGYNPFVDPNFEDAPKPSTLKSLKYLAELACAAGSELFGSDKARLREIERLGWQLEKEEKRAEEERLKQLADSKKNEDDDSDY